MQENGADEETRAMLDWIDRRLSQIEEGRRTLNLEWWVLVTVAQRLRKGELRGNLQGWGPREESGWEGWR